MNKTQIILALTLLSIIALSSLFLDIFNVNDASTTTIEESKVKHGEIRQYTKGDRLKTIVNYDQGVKQGTSYLFHEDGETVLLAMPYENGLREGTSKKYYEDGTLYASTSYKNDKLHGPRLIYYSNGVLKAEMNYGYGYPGINTKEYLIDGSLKEAIQITSQQEGNLIRLTTTDFCKDKKFYIGKLIEDQFFDPIHKNIKLLEGSSNDFYVDLSIYTPSYLKYQDIICKCTSKQGNPIVLRTRLY